MYISKEFHFDAAHNLIRYKGKCENLHGHTYKLRVTLEGVPDPDSGMIIDFGVFKQIVEEKVLEELDHHYINEIIEQSTAENIADWIWEKIDKPLKSDHYKLYEIILWETESSFVSRRNEKK
jgi:6-pyruvoyltetrahydropterin/6-carboxytetrahydropterin synthase